MAIRNPFNSWSSGFPKPKPFRMPNQGMSDNEMMGGQKFQGLYSPPEPAAPPEKRDSGGEWNSYLSEMQDLYTKQGPAASAYKEHLNTLPQQQDQTGWGKFGAALVGASEGFKSGGAAGWNAAQNVRQAPYRQAMEEWGVKEQALGRQAGIEDDSTNRRLQFMKEVRSSAKDDQEASRWMDEFELKERTQEADAEHKKAQERNWESQGYVKDYDEQGNIIFINPRNGQQQNFGPSSKKTDWAKDDARIGIARRGAATGERNATANEGRLGIARRTEDRMNTREYRLENPPIDAREQSAARASAYSRAEVENPTWGPFVTPDGGIDERKAAKNPAEFAAFMKRVEEIEAGIFGRTRSLGGSQEYEY